MARQHHGQIAQALENRFPDTAETSRNWLRIIYTAAGTPELAIDPLVASENARLPLCLP
jgi:hypothetical protein